MQDASGKALGPFCQSGDIGDVWSVECSCRDNNGVEILDSFQIDIPEFRRGVPLSTIAPYWRMTPVE
jgi:hypothetical protein